MSARHVAVLVVGVMAISWAAPLIRLASPAPALTIAALRLAIAAPPMILLAAIRREEGRAPLAGRDRALLVASALALAAHFAFWVVSVQRTSILASVVLVTMQPLFVAVGAWLFLGERPTRPVVTGIALGTAGAAVLVGAGPNAAATLQGNLYALAGGAMSSVYLVIGRGARRRLSTTVYGAVVYGLAAVALLALALAAGAPLGGQPRSAYLYILLLAIVPQLIGHNAMNWALGSLSAAVVAVAILGEPVGSALIAAVLLDEVPTVIEAAGGALVLAGVYVALLGARADRGPLRAPIEV